MCLKNKSLKGLILVFVVCGIVISSCTRQTPVQKPVSEGEILLTPKHFNLGNLSKSSTDTIHPFEFDIQNLSTDTMYISKIEPSCGCLKVNNNSNFIAPNEHGKITGKINVAHQSGHLSKSIFLTLNNDDIVILRVIGDIK